MAYRYGKREQMSLLPPSIDDYVSESDPVRAYDSMIDAMDLENLGLEIDSNKVGNSSYYPVTMLKLLVYGCSYGINSSRKLERAVYHNLSFIWLTGGLKPDHKTIANFRKNNPKLLKNVLKESVHICRKLNLIKGNELFLDGTKIKGNCSSKNTKSKDKLQRDLANIEEEIEKRLNSFDKDTQEEPESYVEMDKELSQKMNLKEKIEKTLKIMEEEGLKEGNTTDPDTINGGSDNEYNGQITVGGKYGLIVESDIVSQAADANLFTDQITNANKRLGEPCSTSVADAGYFKLDDLKEIHNQDIDVIVPSQKQAEKNPIDNPFSKDKFFYNKKNDSYICPEGKKLTFSNYDKSKENYIYRIEKRNICKRCKNYGKCTTSKRGRRINRRRDEEIQQEIKANYESEQGQKIYNKRKFLVEKPFAYIKSIINGSQFLLRGIEKVKGEFAQFATCYNLRRMITILGGVRQTVTTMQGIKG